MKRAFIRALWGVHDDSDRVLKRRYRMDKNVPVILKNKFNEPFITYVFGQENYDELKRIGCQNLILLSKEPHMFDPLQSQYRHKLEIIRYAMEEDGYDEILHLDWDCIPQKRIPSDFWETLGKKETFQGCLQSYKHAKCHWREKDRNVVPNGGFVYFRDKNAINKIIKIWEDMGSKKSAEPPMAKYVDEQMGGWKGRMEYWKLYEIDFCNLHKNSAHPKELILTKNQCFIHNQGTWK